MKERVHLAPTAPEHIARFMELSGDPELIATMGWLPFGPEERQRFLAFTSSVSVPGYPDGETRRFSILTREDDRPIGFVALQGMQGPGLPAELAIAIMEPAFRGKGLGTETLRLALDLAFGELGLSRVGLSVFATNSRARTAYSRLGFVETALLEKAWEIPGSGLHDLVIMEMERERWLDGE